MTKKYDNILLSTKKYKIQRDYWVNYLYNLEVQQMIKPRFDGNGRRSSTVRQEEIRYSLQPEVTGKLIKLSRDSDVTLYVVLLSAFMVFLYRYSDSMDVYLGSPVYKENPDEHLLNDFVVLRMVISEDMTFKDVLVSVKDKFIKSCENQDYPFDKIIDELSHITGNSYDLLFNLVFASKNIHDIERANSRKDNDLLVFFIKEDNNITLTFRFNESLYSKDEIKRDSGYFNRIIRCGADNPSVKISQMDMLSDEEKQQILTDFNSTGVKYPKNKTIPGLFREQVDKAPEAVAVVYENKHLTYGKLNRKVTHLACLLRAKGVGPDCIAATMVERSLEMVIGILGILNAGGAYLPIDPDYPQERVDYMLKDSKTKVLLAAPAVEVKEEFIEILDISKGFSSSTSNSTSTLSKISPANLAYIIYTSGTTGRPKGVAVEHRGVVNTLICRKEEYNMTPQDVSLQLFSYSFDGFVTSFFTPLLSGVRSVFVEDGGIKDITAVKDVIIKEGVTHFISVPVLYQAILESLSPGQASGLKVITLAGDRVTPDILELTKQKNSDLEIVHEYGVTEASVMSTLYRHQEQDDMVKIGAPVWNTRVYIVNQDQGLQPVGASGELCIGGDGLARGYLNNPELTAGKFLTAKTREGTRSLHPTHPLTHSPYSPIYKTGDLARWLPDGNIEFLGRIDQQVKIRGFRIELGEIENRLLKHDNIKGAIVIPVNGKGKDAGEEKNDNKDRYLCAYIISEKKFTVSELREYLQRDLPDYMIPLNVVQLEQIPLSANGKVNRKALPIAEFKGTAKKYAAPTDEVQEALVDVWQQVLGIERIGIDDNFFELGGDSIKSIQISARLQERRLKLKISDIFSSPTIRQLSRYVEKTGIFTHQGPVEGEVVLTPIQRYFFESNFTDLHHFNHSVMLYKRDGFDEEIIANVFTKLVEHHDALRMVYQVEEDGVVQVNRGTEGKLFHLEVIDFRGEEEIETKIEREAGRIQGSIDLQEGPLVKLGLFKTKQGDHLLIVIYHLVVDGVSWRILLEDLAAGYRQVENNEKIRFPEKTISFKYWAEKLGQYAESKEILRELDYWRAVEETVIEPLPRDFHVGTPKKKLKYCDTVQLGLNEADTLTLLKDVNQAYNTEINDILLTALGMAIKEWGGVEKVLINLEGHGREEIIEGANISRTVGWFTSQFPVILDMKTSGDLSYVIKSVKETLRRIPNKGIGYGILRYLTPAEKRVGLRPGLEPEISFNYLGQFGQEDNHRDSIVRISELNAGDSISPGFEMNYALNVNGILVGQKLELSFSYNMHEYRKSSIRELADHCKANLLKIIRHCAGKEETELTPSDLVADDVDLSLEDLDSIKAIVDLNIEE